MGSDFAESLVAHIGFDIAVELIHMYSKAYIETNEIKYALKADMLIHSLKQLKIFER